MFFTLCYKYVKQKLYNMKKFEYKEIRYQWMQTATKELNELGKQGWELVGVTQELDGCDIAKNFRVLLIRYTLKRELNDNQ